MRKAITIFITGLLLIFLSWMGIKEIKYRIDPLGAGSVRLVYLSQPGSGDESILLRDLKGNQRVLLQQFGSLLEMKPSPDGKWLALLMEDGDGQRNIALFSMQESQITQTFSCESGFCDQLSWHPDGMLVYFHFAQGSGADTQTEQHQILSLSVQQGEITPLVLKEEWQPLSYSVSPNGFYQAVYDQQQKGFHIMKEGAQELLLIKSQDPSVLEWQTKPDRVWAITTENLEKIPVSHLVEVNLETLNRRYLKDATITNMDYNNLNLHPKEDQLIFGCRPVLRTLNRQICSANLTDFMVEPVTDVQTRNHTAMVISPDGDWLAYQTLELTSSTAVPAVWVMNWKTHQTEKLVENAAFPQWIP